MPDPIGVPDFETTLNAEPDASGLIQRPLIPLRGFVIYPNIVTPITLDDPLALAAARAALDARQTAIAVTLRHPDTDTPKHDDFHPTGTEIALGRLLPMADGTATVLVQGRRRVTLVDVTTTGAHLQARARSLDEIAPQAGEDIEVLGQTIANLFEHTATLNDALPDEIIDYVLSVDDPIWLADFVTSTLTIPLEDRQRVLNIADLEERLRFVATLLSRELNMLELKDEIAGQIQHEMARNQREAYLREQMRAIQTELGEEDIFQQELNDLREQIHAAELPADVHERALKELGRLAMMPPMAPEVGIIRTYIDWIVALPWTQRSDDNLDLARAQKILDDEHHGLPRVKDRVLETIAVRKLAADKMKSPILCFVGPPGVGKTSMGKSIASALGREFVRVSLGGVRDEAEVRGHRRTYIGALPGRIIQTMRRAGTINPVFMLDEIDKLGADFRGDPADALLETLDPEQNRQFSDHYLEADYDLSQVLFITTANDLNPLPPALLDRLEIVEFPGYMEEDKLAIARRFLIPRQLHDHGLEDAHIHFDTAALQTIIRDYTYEAGVRNLNREIANACRKIARFIAEERRFSRRVTAEHITRYLGPPPFISLRANDEDTIGVATGLAWTPAGGDVMTIEVSLLPGKGNLMMTGQLGEVMQESAQAALSYMRSRAEDLDVPHDDFENLDVHIHLPEGAVPKDGPSAGITLTAALVSAFTERRIRADYAMTGEITLRGRVLPVGGIKEKVLAARRARIPNIILPALNRKDMADLPAKAQRDLNIVFVEDMQEVMDLVIMPPPQPDNDDPDSEEDSS